MTEYEKEQARAEMYCNQCGEDENFDFMYARARNDWFKCRNCGQEVTCRNE